MVLFLKQLQEGDTIFLRPKDLNTIEIFDKEPKQNETKIIKELPITSEINEKETLDLLVTLTKENRQLREFNNELIVYKDRLEKYNNLDYIFEDEKFMEDWLEKNIHKAIPNIEIIERQPIISWKKEKFMRNKPDFFCIDKTTKEFVIVENKVRGRNRTIGTQYLTYKAWAKNNIDLINEKYEDFGLKC